MNLSLKDRVLILSTVLPQFDTRQNIELKKKVSKKIQLSDNEQQKIIYENQGNGQYNISFNTADAITQSISYEFDDEELFYLKQRVNFLDQNRMFSLETIDTYSNILEASFETEEYKNLWNTIRGAVKE